MLLLCFFFHFLRNFIFYFRNNKEADDNFSLWPRHIKGSFFRVRGSLVFSTRVNFSSPPERPPLSFPQFYQLRWKVLRRHPLWAASAIRNACAQNGTASGYDIGIYVQVCGELGAGLLAFCRRISLLHLGLFPLWFCFFFWFFSFTFFWDGLSLCARLRMNLRRKWW